MASAAEVIRSCERALIATDAPSAREYGRNSKTEALGCPRDECDFAFDAQVHMARRSYRCSSVRSARCAAISTISIRSGG